MNLAQVLLELDAEADRNEAHRLLLKVIEAQPFGDLTSMAKELRGSITVRDLRQEQPDRLRQDAVSFCLQALRCSRGRIISGSSQ